MNKKYKVIYDRENCIGANKCMGIHPQLWEADKEEKAVLIGGKLNSKTGKFELPIDEQDLVAYKESALICPAYVIDIVDSATMKSVLNIKPTKAEDKDK